jgi:cytochrome P450
LEKDLMSNGYSPGESVRRLLRTIENFFLRHPALGRYGLGLLRIFKPVLRIGDVTIVTRASTVREVLSRDNDFTIALYSPKMEAMAGRFVLSMQDSPDYEHDASVLRVIVPRTDMPTIAAHVSDIVAEILTHSSKAGRMDVVSELTDAVPARLAARYFGAPGPDERVLVRWTRAIFRELFYNLRNDPAISGPAHVASAEMRRHLDDLITARRNAPAEHHDDVLGRMLRLQADPAFNIDDHWIRTYIFGLIVGMLPLTSKATALALNVMLSRPGLLAAAQQAAYADDDALLWRYTSEAMRIAPQSPGQFRVASADWTIGDTRRRHVVAAGTRVFASTQAAMFDSRAFPSPRQIRTDRPQSSYFHFGYGLHACFGRYISYEVQIPAIVKAIVRQRDLRRATGHAGHLGWDGPFPSSLNTEFEPA